MKIRLAEKHNQKAITELLATLDTPHFNVSSDEVITKEIENGWHYVIYDETGTVKASLALRMNEGSYEIITIASQKPGAGRRLIQFAIDKCKKDKIPKLWCWSLARYNSRGFYEKMGFDEQILLKNQWFGQDCWFFGKNIEF